MWQEGTPEGAAHLEVDLICPSETRGIGHWSNQTSRIEGKS